MAARGIPLFYGLALYVPDSDIHEPQQRADKVRRGDSTGEEREKHDTNLQGRHGTKQN